MKIAIIGAGIAGLVSLKYALESGHKCDTFELTGELGGTWVYTEQYGVDEFGFPTQRTMYQGLKTNLPKEVMQFLDFPYPLHMDYSFLTQLEVLQYLHDYALKFNLEKYIQYFKRVVKVTPQNEKWIVTVMDVKTKSESSTLYDAVFVCNGHYFHPHIPKIVGQGLFKGLQMHSRDYRKPNMFENKRILIIGASYSGIDIANHISTVAKSIFISHWRQLTARIPNIIIKPRVKQFCEHEVVFSDESKEEFDIVLYCTGYEYVYPFLTKECGVTVEDNWVRHLHKHVINIEKPTLCFIGIPFLVPAFFNCDLQARFALASIEGKFVLPPKSQMIQELEDYINKLRTENIPQRYVHKIGLSVTKYFSDLAEISGIRPIPPVISSIYTYLVQNYDKLEIEKVQKYMIIDDNNFLEIKK